jgi:hypothetical protein
MAPEIPTPEPVAELSELSRLSGIFFEPQRAFTDIARCPRWIVPLLLIVVAALAYTFTFTQHIGWARFMRQTMEGNARMAQPTPEQRDKAIETQARFAPIMGYVGVVVGIPAYSAIAAGVLLLVFNAVLSAQLKFKQVFAIMCYSGLPGLLFTLLAIGVMFLKNPDDFNLRNPLMFNPGAFMDPNGPQKFLYALLSSLDLFTFWTIVLVAIGLSTAGRKVSLGSALSAVILPWAIWVLAKSSVAGLFG